MPEAWETVLMWAAAWGALALLKRHFGLAIEVGRQGQEQARQRRKSLPDRVAFLHPHPSTPLLVTHRKTTLLLIGFQESSPGETAERPQTGPEADDMLSQDRPRLQKPRKATDYGRRSRGTEERGSSDQQHSVLLVRVCMDSAKNHGLQPWRGGSEHLPRSRGFVK